MDRRKDWRAWWPSSQRWQEALNIHACHSPHGDTHTHTQASIMISICYRWLQWLGQRGSHAVCFRSWHMEEWVQDQCCCFLLFTTSADLKCACFISLIFCLLIYSASEPSITRPIPSSPSPCPSSLNPGFNALHRPIALTFSPALTLRCLSSF